MPPTNHRAEWERLPACLDPLIPAGRPDKPELVRVERPYSPLGVLVNNLRRPDAFGLQRALVHGPQGSGKSTELLAVAARLANVHLVVRIDLLEHFANQRGDVTALDYLQAWEVLAVVGLAMHRFGEEVLGHPWTPTQTGALQSAIAAPSGVVPATIDVGKLAKEIALVVAAATDAAGAVGTTTLALKSVAAVAGAVSQTLPLGLPHRPELPDQDGAVQRLRAVVADQLTTLFQTYDRRPLLIIDGLDRAGEATATRLFERSQVMAELPCHQLVCVPPSTRVRNVRGYDPMPICNVPVVDRERAPQPATGVDFFWNLWVARTKAAGVAAELAPREVIDTLGWASGGMSRVFLGMVGDAVAAAWDEDCAVLSDTHVATVIDKWRRRWEEGMTSTSHEALDAVAAAYNVDGSELQAKLLDELCIVPFPNQSVWYYPHPLLTEPARAYHP